MGRVRRFLREVARYFATLEDVAQLPTSEEVKWIEISWYKADIDISVSKLLGIETLANLFRVSVSENLVSKKNIGFGQNFSLVIQCSGARGGSKALGDGFRRGCWIWRVVVGLWDTSFRRSMHALHMVLITDLVKTSKTIDVFYNVCLFSIISLLNVWRIFSVLYIVFSICHTLNSAKLPLEQYIEGEKTTIAISLQWEYRVKPLKIKQFPSSQLWN